MNTSVPTIDNEAESKSEISFQLLQEFCAEFDIAPTRDTTEEVLTELSDSNLVELHSFLIKKLMPIHRNLESSSSYGVARYCGSVQAHYMVVDHGKVSFETKKGESKVVEFTEPGVAILVDCLPLAHTFAIDELKYAVSTVVLDDSIELLKVLHNEIVETEENMGRPVFIGALNMTNATMSDFAIRTLGFHTINHIEIDIGLTFDAGNPESSEDDRPVVVFMPVVEMVNRLSHLEKLRDRAYKLGVKSGEFESSRDARLQLINYLLNRVDSEWEE